MAQMFVFLSKMFKTLVLIKQTLPRFKTNTQLFNRHSYI